MEDGIARLRCHVSKEHRGFKGVNEKECRVEPQNNIDNVGIDDRAAPLNESGVDSPTNILVPSTNFPGALELKNTRDRLARGQIKSFQLKKGGIFYCKRCNDSKSYKSYTGFSNHVYDIHINPGVKYKCPISSCNFIANTFSHLRHHVSKHHRGFKGLNEKQCRIEP